MQKTIALTVAAFALFLAAPLFAYDAEGFFVTGDIQMLGPTNIDHSIGVIEDESGSADTYNKWQLDYGSDLSFRLGGGYSWAEKGRLSLTYWDYSDDEVERRYLDSSQYLDDSFFGTYVNSGYYLQGASEIDATSIEIAFEKDRDFDNPWTLTWKVGLRYVDFEETVRLDWLDDLGSPYEWGYDLRTIDASGIGPTVGIGGAHHFAERWSVVGNASLSYVFGDSETKGTEYNEWCCWGDDTDNISHTDDSAAGLITDLNAGVNVNVWGGLDLALLYTFSSWEDLVTNRLGNGDDIDDEMSFPIRDNVTFHGLNLRFRWLFGRE
ncbi:MAG: hypothetical protein JSV08_09915 [Acidobacteriota bacterium]|nr:MAG: hypothetical protein JSV08_09915 [Acidobacteriota bacterium]